MIEKCKTLKLLKSLRLFVAIAPLVLLFGGCGWFVPYSLQPSYHKFKKMCKLDPELYQGNIYSEEYYNKVLALFDTSLDKIDWEYIQKESHFNGSGEFLYKFERYDGRINLAFFFVFKNERAARDNIDYVWSYVSWRDLRPYLTSNEGTGFYISGDREICARFKKR